MAQEHKKDRKYTYDYPENREMGAHLSVEDRKWIADKLQKHPSYLYYIFVSGTRNNQKAIDLAKILIQQKQEREQLAKNI